MAFRVTNNKVQRVQHTEALITVLVKAGVPDVIFLKKTGVVKPCENVLKVKAVVLNVEVVFFLVPLKAAIIADYCFTHYV
jgi:hypothetical protein